jgi:hypothetical protein
MNEGDDSDCGECDLRGAHAPNAHALLIVLPNDPRSPRPPIEMELTTLAR